MFLVRKTLINGFSWYKSGGWTTKRESATELDSLEEAKAIAKLFKASKTLKILEYKPFSEAKLRELAEVSKRWRTQKNMTITWG